MKKIIIFFLLLECLLAFSHTALGQQTNGKKPCTDKAINLLQKKDKNGYEIVSRVNDMAYFSLWLMCEDTVTYGVGGAVHETAHKLDIDLSDYAGMRYSYYLGSDNVLSVSIKNLFHRSEISEYLDAFDKGLSYYELYLTGDSGAQDLLLLLEELNAYTHGLNTSLQLIDKIPKNSVQSDRDGLASFMYYLELYLRKAREHDPEQWKKIYGDAEYLALIQQLWKRAETKLTAALKYPQLGMQDKFILKKVYENKNLGEIEKTFEKCGISFAYDHEIPLLVKNLKQTALQTQKNKNIKTIKTQQKSTTTTIKVDGKEMSLEEFLKEHPEMQNDPQMQEMLKKMQE